MQRFFRDTNGATSIEYGVIALVIGAALVGEVSMLAGDAGALWQSIADAHP